MPVHNHEHEHTVGSSDYAPGYFEIMEIAVGELLVEKQLIGAGEIRRQIEVLDFAHAGAGREGRGEGLGRPRLPSPPARKRPRGV